MTPAATRRFLEALALLPSDRRLAAVAAMGQFLAEIEQRSVKLAGRRTFQIRTLKGDLLVLHLGPEEAEPRILWLDIRAPGS